MTVTLLGIIVVSFRKYLIRQWRAIFQRSDAGTILTEKSSTDVINTTMPIRHVFGMLSSQESKSVRPPGLRARKEGSKSLRRGGDIWKSA
jgi:hypothetical protein